MPATIFHRARIPGARRIGAPYSSFLLHRNSGSALNSKGGACTSSSSSSTAGSSKTQRVLRRSLHAMPSESLSISRSRVSSASSVFALCNNTKETNLMKHHNQLASFARRFASTTPTTDPSPPTPGNEPPGTATATTASSSSPSSTLKRLPRRPRFLRNSATTTTVPAARATTTSPDPLVWLTPRANDTDSDHGSVSGQEIESKDSDCEMMDKDQPIPSLPPRETAARLEEYDGDENVLDVAAAECEQLLGQFRGWRRRRGETDDAPAIGCDHSLDEHTHHEQLMTALGCLLDISRRPRLLEAISKQIDSSGKNSRQGNSFVPLLAIHRAFVFLLSTSVTALRSSTTAKYAMSSGSSCEERRTGEGSTSMLLLLEHVVRVARQAHRLDLPLHLPWYQDLARVIASTVGADDTTTSSAASSATVSSFGDDDKTIASTISLLLEISEWQSSSLRSSRQSFDKCDTEEALVVPLEFSSNLPSMKLRFLVPVLKDWMEQRRYDAVQETVVQALLVRPGDDNNNEEEENRGMVVLDIDVVFALFMALFEFPGNDADKQAVYDMLEPSALHFFRANRDLLRTHPQVRAFLSRFFFLSRRVGDYDPDDDDDDDPDVVWDPIVAQVFLESIAKNDRLLTLEDRLSVLSQLYGHIDAAIQSKMIHVARVMGDGIVDEDTSSSDGSDDEKGHADDNDDSDWNSDDTDYESEDDNDDDNDDGEDDEDMGSLEHARRRGGGGDSDPELALRRHDLYLRGRGRVLDAGHLPDVTWQAMQLNRGLNLRFTDDYEEWVWKRDFPDDEDEDDEDDDLSIMTLHDPDDDPYSSGDDDDGGGGGGTGERY